MKENETGVKALNKIKQTPDVREPWAAVDFMESPAGDPMYVPVHQWIMILLCDHYVRESGSAGNPNISESLTPVDPFVRESNPDNPTVCQLVIPFAGDHKSTNFYES